MNQFDTEQKAGQNWNDQIYPVEIVRVTLDQQSTCPDIIAVEEPLEIRLDFAHYGSDISASTIDRKQKSVSVTMRTPGHDFELALGFLLTEGVLSAQVPMTRQILNVHHCGPAIAGRAYRNVVKIVLDPSVRVPWQTLERNFYTTSSCGVCGKASIEALRLRSGADLVQLHGEPKRIAKSLIPLLPERLRVAQEVFSATGGLHASGLFSNAGELQVLREDVGRHNALDKVIGWSFTEGKLPLRDSLLVLSGRISFELVQKAAMAGISSIVAVGAPSSLALQLAREVDILLIGFTRGERFNVYHGENRLF